MDGAGNDGGWPRIRATDEASGGGSSVIDLALRVRRESTRPQRPARRQDLRQADVQDLGKARAAGDRRADEGRSGPPSRTRSAVERHAHLDIQRRPATLGHETRRWSGRRAAVVGDRVHRVAGAVRRDRQRGRSRSERLARGASTPTAPSRGWRPSPRTAPGPSGTTNHSCWMLLNGIAHDEAPGTPGYSAEGDAGGQQRQRRRVELRVVDQLRRATSTCGCRDRSTPSASCAPT